MTARGLVIVEVAVVDGERLVPPIAFAVGRWHYSAAAHGVAFVYSSTQSARDSFKPETPGVPRKYRPFGHLAFIQIKSYTGRSLKTLIPTAVSIWGRLASGLR